MAEKLGELKKETVDYYKVVRQFGSGSFGVIHVGVDKYGKEVALKMEAIKNRCFLRKEAQIYKALLGTEGIPKFRWYGLTTIQGCLIKTLAIDLLGPNLGDMLKLSGNRFSLKTVLLMADQLITRLEVIHEHGFLHRDLKAENLTIGLGSMCSTIYIIDFGLAKQYLSSNGDHIPYKQGHTLCGTARYVSLNIHRGIEPARRDDMIALGHLLLYFLRGNLPWQSIPVDPQQKQESYRRVMEMKERVTMNELCNGFPEEFQHYLLYCQTLKFGEKPDYEYLRKLLHKVAARKKYNYDGIFDWNTFAFPELDAKTFDTSLGKSFSKLAVTTGGAGFLK